MQVRARWPVMAGPGRAARPSTTTRPSTKCVARSSPQQPLRRPPCSALCRAGADNSSSSSGGGGGVDGGGDGAAAATTATAPAALTTADFEESAVPPAGCSRYTVNIKKPLGLVLEQDTKTLVLRVAALSPEGAAERAGVTVGDQLIAVSGITYDKNEAYGEVVVKKGQQRVRMSARGETLRTVGAAIASHPGNWEVTLEFQRCGGPSAGE
jgi:hypothetical protein